MKCSITASISKVETIWKDFTKTPGYNPYSKYITGFEDLSLRVKIISEIYPPYAVGWVKVELEVETYFQEKIDNWNKKNPKGSKVKFDDVVAEVKHHRTYLKRLFELLLSNHLRIKKRLREKLLMYVESEDYLENLLNVRK